MNQPKPYKTLFQTVQVELAEWRLAKAKGEVESWGNGYIRALELVEEWIHEMPCTGTCGRCSEASEDTTPKTSI